MEGSRPVVVAALLSQGGGILSSYRNTAFPMIIRNSIVASNRAGATPDITGVAHESYPDVRGFFTSEGNNLIGNAEGSMGFNPIEDLLGSESNPIDPMLGPLLDNGGLTFTHALLRGSPAIDAGSADIGDAPAFDQRGKASRGLLTGE